MRQSRKITIQAGLRCLTGGRVLRLALLLAAALTTPAHAAGSPPPLAIYGRLPGFESARISPSGRHTAILGTIDDRRTVIVVDAAGQVVANFPVGPIKVRSIDWAGDQALLINFSKTVRLAPEFYRDRTELTSTIVLPLAGGKPWAVFADKSSITGGVRGYYGALERGGRWYGYFGAITMEKGLNPGEFRLRDGTVYPDLYEVDLATRDMRRIAIAPDGGQIEREWLIDGSGTIGATLDYNRLMGSWEIRNSDRQVLASGTSPSARLGLVSFSHDGASIIYTLRNEGERRDDWFAVPLAGGTAQPYLADASIGEVVSDRGHRLLGYIDDRADDGSAHLLDAHQQKIFNATRKAFPAQRTSLVDFTDTFQSLIVKTEGGGDPIAWWRVDIATGKAVSLGRSYPMEPEQVGAFRMIPYTAADGLAMEGVLTLPPGRPEHGLPVVVLPHGGPTSHDSPGFDWIAQAFASRGYAVFQPNFRGSDGYGAQFELAGHGEWGRKMQSDVSDGLAELARLGIVDPHRACIVGASYGGYAALAGVTLQQGIYRCAVAVAGVSDLGRLVSNRIKDSGGDSLVSRLLHEEVGKGHDLQAVSPLRFVGSVTVPVMLIHGKDDTVVDPEQSTLMVNALRKAGKQVEFVVLPEEDHWLSTSATRQQMLEAAVGFVMRNNPP